MKHSPHENTFKEIPVILRSESWSKYKLLFQGVSWKGKEKGEARSGGGSRVPKGSCSDAKNNCMLVCAYTSKSHMGKIQSLSKKSLVQQMRPSQKLGTMQRSLDCGEMQLPWIHLHQSSYIYSLRNETIVKEKPERL